MPVASESTLTRSVAAFIATGLLALTTSLSPAPAHAHEFTRRNTTSGAGCLIDQSVAPGNLTQCGNSTLYSVWRPKARFIAPEGWMNDPQGLFQRSDGKYHAGYQCHPQHYLWGNISQCSAVSSDFVYWNDLPSWEDPKTLYPSRVYDIRGVFDGTIIPAAYGWNGYPTTIYTSVFPGPLGATSDPPEQQGTESQSLAYTMDNGASWTKLNFGVNPIIWQWPMQNLTGFRDPFVFESPRLSALLANRTSTSNTTVVPTGTLFLTISGGIRLDADPSGGPRLFLYRQTRDKDVTSWTYLGPLVSIAAKTSWSPWSGNNGINFETAGVTRVSPSGLATTATNTAGAHELDIVTYGTEGGRDASHESHWPLWAAVNYTADASTGAVTASTLFAGVLDWGRVYASTYFDVVKNGAKRVVTVSWTYEDDENNVLAAQRGYQGAFTLFKDLFTQVIANVDPSQSGLNDTASWTTVRESDGSLSVVTLGQRIVPEITSEYRSKSKVSSVTSLTTLSSSSSATNGTNGYVAFPQASQPSGRFYVVAGNFTFPANASKSTWSRVGFRVLASGSEHTDIYYDPVLESIVIDRTASSLVKVYGNGTESGKLRLFTTVNPRTGVKSMEPLQLTVVVDNSVIEVVANERTVITTRVYPWLSSSVNAGFLALAPNATSGTTTSGAVPATVSGVQVWDGLVNAWPGRPSNIPQLKPLVWDGPLPGVWGTWSGV